MHTTTYGYKRPDNNDTGDIFWDALVFNINQLNSHNHDGVTSAPLALQSGSVASGSWVAAPIGGGVYRQAITLPAGLAYDTCQIWFKLSTGDHVYPSVEKISSSQFYVYTNDNTKTYTAFYR